MAMMQSSQHKILEIVLMMCSLSLAMADYEMPKIVSVLLQICFLSPIVCKQLSAPDQPSCFAFLLIARQQLGKSYKLFIYWLLAEILWMLINSCDV